MWEASEDERACIEGRLDDVVWLADGVEDVEVALTFFPRREWRRLGGDWSALPSLRLIQSCTAGLNHMGWDDLPDVPVAAAPGATGPFIAEYVLATTLAWARGLIRHTQDIRRGRFDQGAPVRSLASLRVGLVGYGGIGQATARLLSGLGATVEAVSRSGQADDQALALVERLGTMADLNAMMARSDVVVLCLPLTADTEGLIGIDGLSGMMGRPALLINVGRGPLVKEGDLFAWLDSSHTKHAAALDVWWRYPTKDGERPFSEAFESLPNVVMTPHNSPNVEGFRLAMIDQACRQVRHFIDTGEALEVHDPAWYRTDAEGDGR